MDKTLKQVVKTGYGLGLLSLAEAKKIAARCRKELKLSDEESLKLARELVANSEKASKEVLATVEKYFDAALVKSGVASKGEVKMAKKLLKRRAGMLKKAMRENLRSLQKRGKK